MVHLRQLHEAYGNRVEFLFVVIREAGHSLPEEMVRAVEGQAPTDDPQERRRRMLRAGIEHYHLPFLCLIDTADAKVERLYTAYPERLVLVDITGRIAQPSGPIESWLSVQSQPD